LADAKFCIGCSIYPYQKKETTYLIISPAPKDRPELNGEWWKKGQVKIDSEPDKVFRTQSGYVIEKYYLADDELEIDSDPNLIQNLHFR